MAVLSGNGVVCTCSPSRGAVRSPTLQFHWLSAATLSVGGAACELCGRHDMGDLLIWMVRRAPERMLTQKRSAKHYVAITAMQLKSFSGAYV